MATKKTRKQIEDEIAALQADLESTDDEDTELLVEHPTTKAVGRLRGAHAKSFLDSILGPVGKAGDDDQEDDADDVPAPKKTRKARPAPDDEPDNDGDDEPDPQPRSSVWGRTK